MSERLISGHEVVVVDDEKLQWMRKRQRLYKSGLVRLLPEGWLYPGVATFFLDKLQTFEFRSDDVVLVTYPKSGTTWMQEILWTMLHNPNLDNPTASEALLCRSFDMSNDMLFVDEEAWDEAPFPSFNEMFGKLCPGKTARDGKNIQCLEATPGRRVIKSHYPFQLMRKDLPEKTKVVYVARNPKDVIVSWYHFMRVFKLFSYTGSVEDHVKDFMNNDLVFGPYWPHVKAGWDLRHHPNVYFVFYEELQADIMAHLERLNTFTQANLSYKQLEGIANYTTFSKMKSRGEPVKDAMFNEDLVDKFGGYFRKGTTGDWKNHFTPELQKEVDEWIEKNVAETGVCFK